MAAATPVDPTPAGPTPSDNAPVRSSPIVQELRTLGRSLRYHAGDTLRYLYFMRFSLILWAIMPLLAWLDWRSPGAAQMLRGILTPSDATQWIFTGFSVVLTGWFALLAARIVCSYGPDRFDAPVPGCFRISNRMEPWVFFTAQFPGLLLLWRIDYNAVHEGEGSRPAVFFSLFAGAVLALVFWYLIAVLYYWTSELPKADPTHNYTQTPADPVIPDDVPSAFLAPHWRYLPIECIEQLEPSLLLNLLHWTLGLLCHAGPGYHRHGTIRAGHVVATLTLLCAVVLYILGFSITAPVFMPRIYLFVAVFSSLLAALTFFILLLPALRHLRHGDRLTVRVLPVVAASFILAVLIAGAFPISAPRAFPVIAYVLILLIVVFWALAGVAFFADHYRIPVLTLVVTYILAVNYFPAEHIFHVRPLPVSEAGTSPLPVPSDIVKNFLHRSPSSQPEPLIIVTATGGGIHAASWTADVLAQLEDKFGPTFHRRLLLISSVSGGSVASVAFLREYLAAKPFAGKSSLQRVQLASRCSSLQAVAWGLTYPDALSTLFPFIDRAFPSLMQYDRGWALEVAIERNLQDRACFLDHPGIEEVSLPKPSLIGLNQLARLELAASPGNTAPGPAPFPAFALNSTVVETGDRFLLSNYSAFAEPDLHDRHEILPAASFLGVFAREALFRAPIPGRNGYADLSLNTAARLSASFTFVSPAARIPFELGQGEAHDAFHLVDGGYYDNDGTSSVIEFLRAAAGTFPKDKKQPILLFEIRNGDDVDDRDTPDSYAHQSNLVLENNQWVQARQSPAPWGPVEQLLAPPKAALNAGFGSTTRRNRRDLELLREALPQLEIKQVVLDYQQHIRHRPVSSTDSRPGPRVDTGESEIDQPLSWHLTRRQQNWISGSGPEDDEQTESALQRNCPLPAPGDADARHSDAQKIEEALIWFRRKSGGLDPLPHSHQPPHTAECR